jgi:hypothetical protein
VIVETTVVGATATWALLGIALPRRRNPALDGCSRQAYLHHAAALMARKTHQVVTSEEVTT